MICPHCHKDVEGVWTDVGLGSYEFWGHKETQSRMALVCESCDSELDSEQSYADYISDMKEESGRYVDDGIRRDVGTYVRRLLCCRSS